MPLASLQRCCSHLARTAARDRIARGLGCLGTAELVARATRIATTVVVARNLGPVELGIAAMALTAFEIVRAFAASGIGQLVVRAPTDRLSATLAAATRTGRHVCHALAAVQLLAGIALAAWTGRPELLGLVGCLAGVFLAMPFGLAHCWLLMRANRIGAVAGVSTAQLVADNLLTVVLAVAGLGAWAVVLPKLLTAPVWVVGMRRALGPLPAGTAAPIAQRQVWSFAAPVLASDLLAAARLNLDRVVVGVALGVEALGLYWFAVNAGLGLGLALTAALASAAYPVLAAVAHDPAEVLRRFDRALVVNALPVALVLALQAAMAPVYVPLIFGAHWADAAPLVAILCASALTRPFADVAAQLLRAAGLPERELPAALLVTVLQLGAFALFLRSGLLVAAGAMALTAVVANVAFALWARGVVCAASRRAAPADAPAVRPIAETGTAEAR